LKKYSGQIPGSFGEEDIHELRVEYKKLRAFVRLVKLDKGAGDLKLPGKLKSLYHAAGKSEGPPSVHNGIGKPHLKKINKLCHTIPNGFILIFLQQKKSW